MTELTDKQIRFCEEYLLDNNGTQAAIRAGFSAQSASQGAANLLAKPHVRAYLEQLRDELRETTKMSREKVVFMLLQAHADARDDKQRGAQVRAAELIGKSLGIFVDVTKDETEKGERASVIAQLKSANLPEAQKAMLIEALGGTTETGDERPAS